MNVAEGQGGARAFPYHRGVAPMVWMLVALAMVELAVTHALIAWWWPRVAVLVSIGTLAGVGWLCWATAEMRRRPVLAGADGLLLRVGAIKAIAVPLDALAGVETGGWTAAEIKAPATLNLALLAWPNVLVRLSRPVGRRRRITAVAHRLDDPAGFAAAVEALRGGA